MPKLELTYAQLIRIRGALRHDYMREDDPLIKLIDSALKEDQPPPLDLRHHNWCTKYDAPEQELLGCRVCGRSPAAHRGNDAPPKGVMWSYETEDRCRGGCSRGGEGPACGRPGCQG